MRNVVYVSCIIHRAIIVSLYSAVVKLFLNNEYGPYLYQRECPYIYIYYYSVCVVLVPVRNILGVSHTIVYVSTYYVDSIYSEWRWCHRNFNPDGVRLIIHYIEPVVFIVCNYPALHMQEYINTYVAWTVNINSLHNNLR